MTNFTLILSKLLLILLAPLWLGVGLWWFCVAYPLAWLVMAISNEYYTEFANEFSGFFITMWWQEITK